MTAAGAAAAPAEATSAAAKKRPITLQRFSSVRGLEATQAAGEDGLGRLQQMKRAARFETQDVGLSFDKLFDFEVSAILACSEGVLLAGL
jgi:hypothetical protein